MRTYPSQLHKMKNSIAAQTNQEHREETEEAMQTCSRPRQKYVFIAPHKVGASTSCTIFQRYAISRKLPMMLPIQGVVLSWGISPTEEEYIHTPDEQYHALMNHFTYNKTWLRSKFPGDTAYISIIQDPSKQLRSAMNYYYIPELLKIQSENPLKTFLENPWRYKNRSEVNFAHCNVTWDPTRNFMAFDLGYPTDGVEDKERARRYVNELEDDFTLVLLLDHLDESYVLLKRLMCWELQDVLYVTKNNRSYSFKEYVPSDKEIAMLRRWKAVDYLLHDTFNESLWRKIAAQGPGFFEEVQHFKDVNERVNTYCAERKEGKTNLTVEASRWNSQFEVDAEFCRVLNATVIQLLEPLQNGPKDDKFRLVTERINMRELIDGQPTFKHQRERRIYLNRVKAAKELEAKKNETKRNDTNKLKRPTSVLGQM
ncbi:PREDICTED: galactose-3-O-sulfotransferase 2-like [Branchiostoma belcheri]|uniref:Galactose-3-O-sulfotransferase 2-like n=1 Tax=Branchiostoma belcheri TaxID=7741 RepID=A0A6P4YCM0_BRABE|nr:PREDICTED: galactose-3-O-sulfotransferase 2-like [Branchiostoma belcheri]